jgi:ATP-binding cassette, subfamily C (CFTR/MRP), member 1
VPSITNDLDCQLNNIDFELKRGSLCIVAGPVGSGKSNLLQAILGEMRCTRGSVSLFGRAVYSPQQGWIRNASIRENILFGKNFDSDWYQTVILACCLDHDFSMFEDGDMTEVLF